MFYFRLLMKIRLLFSLVEKRLENFVIFLKKMDWIVLI